MTKRANLGLQNTVVYKLVHYAENRKSGAPSAKMTKRADLEVETLLGTNSCTLLKPAKKWCAQCWSRAENHVSYKRSHFAENGLKVVRPVQKWQNVLLWVWKLWLFSHRGLKTLFCTNSFTLAKKCFAHCGNDKTACSRSEFAVLSKLVQFAKNG